MAVLRPSRRPPARALVVAIAAVCALLVAAAIAAAWPGGPARVCVSSAAASVGPDGTVAETTSPVECDPAGPTP